MADRVLRQRAAPPGDPAGHRGALDPGGGREIGGGQRGQFGVVALEHGLLADPADRAADDVDRIALVEQVRPFDGGERDRLDRAPVDGRHQEPAPLRHRGERRTPVGECHDRHAGVAELAERGHGAGRARHIGQQPPGRPGRDRDDHRVGVDDLRRRRRAHSEAPSAFGAGQLAHHRAGADRGARRLREDLRQRAEPARERAEHRPGRRRGNRGGRGGQQRTGCLGQRPESPRRGGQRRQRRVEGKLRGQPRVHPAEQRVDQPVDDLGPEPGPDILRDGHITVARGSRQLQVADRARDAIAGHHAGRGQLRHVGRHAHELTARQRPQLAPGPDRRRRGARHHQVEPGVRDQRGPFRPGDQQRLGPFVHRHAGDLGGGELAAQPRRPLQHGHPGPRVPQEERRRQPGDPAAHDHHVPLHALQT